MRALTIAGRGAAPAVADLPVSHLDAGQVRVAVELGAGLVVRLKRGRVRPTRW